MLAAAEAGSFGRGGIRLVSEFTGVACSTIGRGLRELGGETAPSELGRVRRPGGGRKPETEKQPELLSALEALVEPTARGDPERPSRWTSKSCRRLSNALKEQGFSVSRTLVGKLLVQLGYTLQGNAKTREGTDPPDRDGQFEYINDQVADFLAGRQPVISVDTKKKELVGDFRNGGREWRPKGRPEEVNVHDFPDKKLGKAAPYGVYDVAHNIGWVNVCRFRDHCKCRHQPRHGCFRRGEYPALVAAFGTGTLSRGLTPVDHSRLRRLQRSSGSALEG